ncbi:MAG: hypothetical protein KF753_22890 [Caldilineaceae bacterium]|nr:hypothetical protein [Caldilineaceae bacterium]
MSNSVAHKNTTIEDLNFRSTGSRRFSTLFINAAKDQEVVIIGTSGIVFQSVALMRAPKPILGSASRLVSIGPDFGDPNTDWLKSND